MKKLSITDLLIFIVSAELVGALSALITGSFSDFFIKYEKPPLMPPAILFPVVWVILYALMGISAYIIYRSDVGKSRINSALKIYCLQLFVNFSWSIVFFRLELLWAAAAVIVLLAILVTAMIISFKKISPLAAYLNIPYLLWVIFATYLNIATVLIN